jgi:serine/threonine protein kinase/Tfp pilus assembly protein PilF
VTPERWARIRELFSAALETPESQRLRFLESACGGDTELRAEIGRMLAGNEEPSWQSPAAKLFTVAAQLEPGQTLAQYRVEAKLGEGGMGVVYKAYDTRLRRQVALKVLPPENLADPESKQRLMREARAASALNHPNIVTVYEIGSEGGVDFIAMEYVEGRSLAHAIPAKGLPLARALDYAIAIAGALAKAHAASVVHRDLKPANIMVTGEGRVKLLDFGLARRVRLAESETATFTVEGAIAGTPAYMSPEQARGLTVDARTDIFSLGVLLYEMIAGRRPFDEDTASQAIAAILEKQPIPLAGYVPEIPEELQRIVTKALEKDREDRYQGVKDLELDLKRLKQELDLQSAGENVHPPAGAKPARPVSSAEYIAGGIMRHRKAAGFSLLALALAGLFFYSRHAPALTDKDTILLADFVNTTGDAVFDDTLKQGLAAQLEQSPFLSILADGRIGETLRFMGRQPDERITNEIGREICQREGVKALIEGSIAALGSHYVLTLVAVNASSSEAIARLQVEAESKERVLHALGGAATQLRRKLGESLASIQKYAKPLEEATTSSLEALKAYSLARQKNLAGHTREALPYARRAVELDPNFAMAHRSLAVYYGSGGEPDLSAESARRAFELRDRVSELERLMLEEVYYVSATGEVDRAIEALETATQTYPRYATAWADLGTWYSQTGQYDKAVAAHRESLRLSPGNAITSSNLAVAFLALNRLADATDAACAQAAARQADSPGCHFVLYEVAFLNGEIAEMKRQLEWASVQPNRAIALSWQAQTARFQGQLRHRRELGQRLAEVSPSRNSKAVAAARSASEAAEEALVGQCRQAEDDSRKALELSHVVPVLASVLVAAAFCSDTSRTLEIANEWAKLYPKDNRLNQAFLPSFRALADIRRNHTTTTIQDLHAANPYGGRSTGATSDGLTLRYCRGEAYLGLRMGAEAAAEFQGILDHRGWEPFSPAYPLAHLGLARAAALTGDLVKSRKA